MADYKLEEMSKEEGEKLTLELQAVLAKYNAEMGVASSIQLLKRIPTDTLTPSPQEFINGTDEGTTEKTS